MRALWPFALLALLALELLVPTAAGERVFWLQGPITIEQQRGPRPQPIARIVYIDAAGFAYRDGIPVDELKRDDLLELVRDLLEYEMALSWPPTEPAGKRRKPRQGRQP